jgi:hypothetical protein
MWEKSRIMDIQTARINTTGAYVCIDGIYPFAMGIELHNGQIPIIRLGGHRDEHETGWQCAVREVYEETRLDIRLVSPQKTYLADWDHVDEELQEIQWKHNHEQNPVPLLVVTYHREERTSLSLMYLAHADGTPMPSSEVKGSLLLAQEDIHRLCWEPHTLGQYLSMGGKAIMNADFDTGLVLEPFAQLRLLSRLLSLQSELDMTR